jgi:hypothetical protein
MSTSSSAIDRDANRQVIASNEALKIKSTWTFVAETTGAEGIHTLFNVTGHVLVYLFGIVDTLLVSPGGNAGMTWGTDPSFANGLFLSDSWSITANDYPAKTILSTYQSGASLSIEPVAGGGGFNAKLPVPQICSSDILMMIISAAITSGVIDFYALWRPLSSDGDITAATPA